MLPGISKIAICLRDRHVFIWKSMERLNVFNILTFQYWSRFSGKRQPFSKNWSTVFYLKALRLKTHHFYTKLPYQKQKLRQIEWWVQHGPVTMNGVLSATTLLFKLCFGLRTSYKEFIWCTNDLNAHYSTFYERWSFLWLCFFTLSILISVFSDNHFHNILRLFGVLRNFAFTTSETMRDYYLWASWYIWVTLRVAELLKT